MIGSLTGKIQYLEAPTIILNVQGVGYEIDVPLSVFCQLKQGDQVTLWTYLAIREDAHHLYGFLDPQDKIIFKTLLKVNGIGAKMALGILSTLTIDTLIYTIEHEDIHTLIKIPGIGKKTAERLIIELRDRFKHFTHAENHQQVQTERLSLLPNHPVLEAESALVSLGYKPNEAQKAVALFKNDFDNSADLIRAALKSMIKK